MEKERKTFNRKSLREPTNSFEVNWEQNFLLLHRNSTIEKFAQK